MGDTDELKKLLFSLGLPATGQVSSRGPNLSGTPSSGLTQGQIDAVNRLAQQCASRTSAPKFIQWNNYGRNVGKTEFMREFGEMNPTVYPSLKRCGLIVTMTLPANTPADCVFMLANRIPLKKLDDYRAEFPYKHYDVAQGILMARFGKVIEEEETVDPNAPVVIKVEYVGAVRQRQQQGNGGGVCSSCRRIWSRSLLTNLTPSICPACGGSIIQPSSGESYASAWVDGGWNVRFPEQVLRDFFPEPPPKFDGNFHKALLHGDINKTFKQLARQWHPDLNRTKGAHTMFLKLRAAYDDLRDPMRRKRYEAGLKFQTQALQKEVVFRVPKSCGLVEVVGEQFDRAPELRAVIPKVTMVVTKILSWTDIFNEQGQVMSSRWKSPTTGRPLWQREGQPFITEWLDNTDFEIDIDV